jgi:hypothetical protein
MIVMIYGNDYIEYNFVYTDLTQPRTYLLQ